MKLEHRLSALLQLHLHSRLNTWLQRVGRRRLQDEMRIISILGLGASYIREFTVYCFTNTGPSIFPLLRHIDTSVGWYLQFIFSKDFSIMLNRLQPLSVPMLAYCWLVHWDDLQWNFNQKWKLSVQENEIKMLSAKWRPFSFSTSVDTNPYSCVVEYFECPDSVLGIRKFNNQ